MFRNLFIAVAMVLLFWHSISCVQAQTQPVIQVIPVTSPAVPVLLVVDGKLVQAESITVTSRGQQVMVWLRDLEKLGWGIITSTGGHTVFQNDKVSLTFIKGEGTAMVNSLTVQLPIDTYLRDGRLMVPLSFVAKSLGYSYDFAYKPVVSISTTPPPAPVITASNMIKGQVLYGGNGIGGIVVRAADAKFNSVKDAVATTDASGVYQISDLPDGSYMAYVYVADNPKFFNRTSELVHLSKGRVVQLQPISLGRILKPEIPKAGTNVNPKAGHIEIAWTSCYGADWYKLEIKEIGTGQVVISMKSSKASASVSASKFTTGAAYEVQVMAFDTAGDFLGGTAGAGSTPWAFTVE